MPGEEVIAAAVAGAKDAQLYLCRVGLASGEGAPSCPPELPAYDRPETFGWETVPLEKFECQVLGGGLQDGCVMKASAVGLSGAVKPEVVVMKIAGRAEAYAPARNPTNTHAKALCAWSWGAGFPKVYMVGAPRFPKLQIFEC